MSQFIDFLLHSDKHLSSPRWVYALVFGIVFAESGFVVTPFLPGDSLLFAVGTLAAIRLSVAVDLPAVRRGLHG